MEQAKSKTQGNPLGTQPVGKLITKFAVPAIISFLVTAIYNIVDQIFIGQGIGMIGMAATNVAFPLTTICTAVSLLIGVGAASNFNLKLGAGDTETASHTAGNALTLATLSGTAIAAIALVCMRPMLAIFGATEQVMPYAIPYTTITALGIPFLVFTTAANNLIRADGSPSYAMVSMLAGAIFNVIFDPVFLFVFNMGIEGIAWATTLGQMLSCGISLWYLVRKFKSVPLKRKHLRPQRQYVGVICRLGMASSINQLAMTAVQIVMNNTLRHYGALSVYGSDIPIAVVGAISKINILFLGFTLGIAQGLQPITSFNYGARKFARVREAVLTALKYVCLISCVAFAVFQLFPRQIISIFGQGSEAYFEFAVKYLRVFMVMTFINGIQPLTSNFYTSIGKAKLGVWISLTRQVLFLIPLVLILPLYMGIDGVLYAGPIADGISAVLAIYLIVRELRQLKTQADAEPAPERTAGVEASLEHS